MRWECSECGSTLERPRPPVVCRECGTAGVIFVRADDDEIEPDSARDAWLRLGLERARLGRCALG